MAINITDFKLDTSALGSELYLADVQPNYEYKDGKKTDKMLGYKYFVVVPALKMEKIGVKVDSMELEFDLDEIPIMKKIEFDNLELRPFQNYSTKQVLISAKADKARLVD